jgi:peptidylprolyl isomerase
LRTGLSLVVVLGLVGSLAACSSSTDAADCTPAKSGSASDAVEVSGKFGAVPTVKIDGAPSPKTTERTVVIEGDGKIAEKGDTVTTNFVMYNAASGEQVTGTDYTEGSETTFDVDTETFLAGIVKTLECSTVGSRVVGVLPPADTWGDAGAADLGVEAGDSVVLVVDIVDVETPEPAAEPLPRAEGEPQPLPEGFPAIDVALAEDGTPTVTLPGGEAPTDLKVAVLQKGDGEEVGPAADVVVHYVGQKWSDGSIFDGSWSRGEPAPFNTSGLIPGFTQAIEGQTVGSQVLVVIPPAMAYGDVGEGNTNELAGETLVFVIDILGLG